MNQPELLQQFEALTDTPAAIPKLRAFVLHLATRGKLLAQCPGDESATELASRVVAAGKRLANELDLKLPAPERAVTDEDKVFPLPKGWTWAKLGDLSIKLGAGSTPLGGKRVYVKSGIKFLRSQNVWNDGLRLDGVAYIPPSVHKNMASTCIEPGDVLLNITGASIGRSAVVPDDFDEANVSQHVSIIRLADKSLRQFIHLCIIAPDFQARIMQVQVGVSREGLSMARLKEFVVAIPPLAEQGRIVAKVEELLELCDTLGHRQVAASEERERLVRSTLDHLTTAATPDDFRRHGGFVLDQFSHLTGSPDVMRVTRQAILSLAVQGRFATKVEGEGQHALARPVSVVESPIPSPQHWAWVRLESLLALGPINGLSPKPVSFPTKTRALTLSATTSGVFRADCFKYVTQEIEPESDLWLRPGDILIQRGNSMEYVGIAALYEGAERQFIYPDLMIKIRVVDAVNPQFAHIVLNSPFGRQFFRSRATGTTGTMPKINQGTLRAFPFPLLPRPEQDRIVAKVEELMRWCDQLEAALAAARATGAQLLDAVLNEILHPPGDSSPNAASAFHRDPVEARQLISPAKAASGGIRTSLRTKR